MARCANIRSEMVAVDTIIEAVDTVIDAVVQIKQEEDGELSWSDPTYCTLQLVNDTESVSTADVKVESDADEITGDQAKRSLESSIPMNLEPITDYDQTECDQSIAVCDEFSKMFDITYMKERWLSKASRLLCSIEKQCGARRVDAREFHMDRLSVTAEKPDDNSHSQCVSVASPVDSHVNAVSTDIRDGLSMDVSTPNVLSLDFESPEVNQTFPVKTGDTHALSRNSKSQGASDTLPIVFESPDKWLSEDSLTLSSIEKQCDVRCSYEREVCMDGFPVNLACGSVETSGVGHAQYGSVASLDDSRVNVVPTDISNGLSMDVASQDTLSVNYVDVESSEVNHTLPVETRDTHVLCLNLESPDASDTLLFECPAVSDGQSMDVDSPDVGLGSSTIVETPDEQPSNVESSDVNNERCLDSDSQGVGDGQSVRIESSNVDNGQPVNLHGAGPGMSAEEDLRDISQGECSTETGVSMDCDAVLRLLYDAGMDSTSERCSDMIQKPAEQTQRTVPRVENKICNNIRSRRPPKLKPKPVVFLRGTSAFNLFVRENFSGKASDSVSKWGPAWFNLTQEVREEYKRRAEALMNNQDVCDEQQQNESDSLNHSDDDLFDPSSPASSDNERADTTPDSPPKKRKKKKVPTATLR